MVKTYLFIIGLIHQTLSIVETSILKPIAQIQTGSCTVHLDYHLSPRSSQREWQIILKTAKTRSDYQKAIAIESIEMTNYESFYDLIVYFLHTRENALTITIPVQTLLSLRLLKIRYLIVQRSFQLLQIAQLTFSLNQSNMTHQRFDRLQNNGTKFVSFLAGFSVEGKYLSQQLILESNMVVSSSLNDVLNFKKVFTVDERIHKIIITLVIYSQNQLGHGWANHFQYTANKRGEYKNKNSGMLLSDQNTFYGLASIKISHLAATLLSISSTFDHQRIISKVDVKSSIISFKVNIIGFIDRGCNQKDKQILFYHSADRMCYQKCPNGYFANQTTYTCQICRKHFLPNQIQSTSCSLQTSNQDNQQSKGIAPKNQNQRILFFPTGCSQPECIQCVMMNICVQCDIGFLVGNGICHPCSLYISNCLQCASSTICTLCDTGYSLSTSNKCITSCTSPCDTCSGSPTSCDTCISGYYYASPNSCLQCGSICLSCTSSSSSCTSCDSLQHRVLSGSSCIPDNGYYQNGNDIADPCTSPCFTCTGSAIFCLVCVQGYYLDNNDCKACHYSCLTCTDLLTCSSCDTSVYRTFNNQRCYPIAGFYDNGVTIAVPCNSNCATCSILSTHCDSCSSGKYLSANTCIPCKYTCDTCSDGTTCDSCSTTSHRTLSGSSQCDPDSGFYDNGVTIAAQCDSSCATCSSISTHCDSCSSRKYLSANACPSCKYTCDTCSDGITCDSCSTTSHRTLSGSSQCDPDSGFYDNGVTIAAQCDSSCATCSSSNTHCDSCNSGKYLTGSNTCNSCKYTCDTCSDGTTCDSCSTTSHRTLSGSSQCDPDSGFYDSGNTIAAQCDANCATCSSSNIHCDSCNSGKYLTGSNTCNSCKYTCDTCSDGTSCDSCSTTSHRTLNSSQCMPDMGYYEGGNTIASECNVAKSHCFLCSNSSVCDQCDAIYYWNTSTSNCQVNCNLTNNCITCSDASGSVSCNTCQYGYTPISGICTVVCGDSMIGAGQQCDDSNAQSGDGCSSNCQVQQYFVCNETGNNNQSVCFLIAMAFSRQSVIKSSVANQAVLNFGLLPPSLPIYATIDWTIALSLVAPTATIFAHYNATTNRLEVSLNYNVSLANSNTIINTNFTGQSNILKYLSPNIINDILVADNNLSLECFSNSDYDSATIHKSIATVIAICSLVMLIVGFFGARIVALEFAAVVQVAFLALATQTNVSPSFESLKELKLSFGFNALFPYSLSTEPVPKQFKMVELSSELYRNYNLAGIFILLPPLIGIVCKLLAIKPFRKHRKILNIAFQFCIAELSFYGFMFCAYLLFDNLAITFLNFTRGIASIGSLIGEIFALAVGALFFVFLEKKPAMFGEFKRRFLKDFVWEKYYNFLMIERLVVSLCLVLIHNIYAQLGAPILIFTVETVIIVICKPYTGRLEWLRPALNQSITTLILGVYLASGILPVQSFIGLNGSTIVISLLGLAVVYNSFFTFKSLKDSYLRHQNLKKELQQDNFEDNQKQKLREMGIKAMANYRSISQLIEKAMQDIPQREIVAGWQHYHLLNYAQKGPFQDIKDKIIKNRFDDKFKTSNAKSSIQLVKYNNGAI